MVKLPNCDEKVVCGPKLHYCTPICCRLVEQAVQRRDVNRLWIYCTACCTTNPQQIVLIVEYAL